MTNENATFKNNSIAVCSISIQMIVMYAHTHLLVFYFVYNAEIMKVFPKDFKKCVIFYLSFQKLSKIIINNTIPIHSNATPQSIPFVVSRERIIAR